MTALITLESVMLRLGINLELKEQVRANIDAAIVGAQVRLESELDSDIAYGKGKALFYLDSGSYSGIQASGMFRLLLDQGFIRSATVSLAEKTGAPLGEIDAGFFKMDSKRGVVLVDADAYRDVYMLVEYESGFVDSEDLGLQGPWIAEALLAYVPLVMNAARSDTSKGEMDGPGMSSYRLSGDMAMGMIQRYNRKLGFTMRPIFTEWAPLET